MKSLRRKFLRFLGFSYLSTLLFPYSLLHAVAKKIINPNLTRQQKKLCSKKPQRGLIPVL